MGQPGKAKGVAGPCSQRTHRVERTQPREPRRSILLVCPTWLPGFSFVELSRTLAR